MAHDFREGSAGIAQEPAIEVPSATLGTSPVWAHFADPPAAGGRDMTILNEFERLVNNASPGSIIRAAIHSLTWSNAADALVSARDRGVDVGVVVDGNVARSLEAAVSRLRDLGAGVRFCADNPAGGCVTTNVGNMHAKFMTLSETTDPSGAARSDVSWFGSANLTRRTGSDKFNDTVTVYEDPNLFRGFNGYFAELWEQNHYAANDFYDARSRRGYYRGSVATVFASPEQNTDLVYSRLNDLTANAAGRIRVAQARFSDGRAPLADLLVAHRRRGTRVWVLVGIRPDGGANIGATVLRKLRRASIPVRKRDIHSKFVAVYGNFRGTYEYRVYTGSHNWTYSANYDNDEVLVRMGAETGADHPLYDAYWAHFNGAYRNAVRA